MNQDNYYRWDTWLKVASLVAVLVSFLVGLSQYIDVKQREFMKSFYDKQLDVVVEVFDALSAMDAATSDDDLKKAAAKFWMIYQGKARTFLDSKMFEKLQFPAEYVATCVTKVSPPNRIHCDNFSASMSASGFAVVAREQLSKTWNNSFSELAQDDPWHVTPRSQ